MSFKPKWTERAAAEYKAIKEAAVAASNGRGGKGKASKQEGLFKQVAKCVNHLLADPRHSGLQTHEYTSLAHPYKASEKVFEAYVQNNTPGAYRLFWCYGPDKGEITIIAITPHP